MHGEILSSIGQVQHRAANLLRDQEADLLRSFRAKLFEIQGQLEKERSIQQQGTAAWTRRIGELQAESDVLRARAEKAERHIRVLSDEASRFKAQGAKSEEERDLLLKQLVDARREVAQLKASPSDNNSSKASLSLGDSRRSRTGESAATQANGSAAAPDPSKGVVGLLPSDEAHLKRMVSELRRLLDSERRDAHQAKTRLAAELARRTEAEGVLRALIDDAKLKIASERSELLQAESLAHSSSSSNSNSSRMRSSRAGARPSTAGAADAGRSSLYGGGSSSSRRASLDAIELREGSTSSSLDSSNSSDWDALRFIKSAEANQREEMLAALLQQEQVLAALKTIVFPPPAAASGASSGAS